MELKTSDIQELINKVNEIDGSDPDRRFELFHMTDDMIRRIYQDELVPTFLVNGTIDLKSSLYVIAGQAWTRNDDEFEFVRAEAIQRLKLVLEGLPE